MGLIRAIRSLWYLWRMRGKVYDYQESINALVESLRAVQDHIRKHETGPRAVTEIEIFIASYLKWRSGYLDGVADDDTWNATWDYFRDHARRWWG